MQPQQFLDLVQCAFFDQSNTQRSQAEQVLLQYKDKCTDEFMLYCAKAFANRAITTQIRIACSTLVKRLVSLINVNNQMMWLTITQNTKNEVKIKFMEQLIDPENDIRRSAANTISEICAIELPRQEWPDLISRLTTNSKHNEVQVRTSAIMTLGYICESLKNHQSSGITQQDSQVILMGICVGMDINEQNVEIRITAIKALQDSLYFMNNLFSQKEIFTYVKNLILQNALSTQNQVKQKALQCLIDFVRQLFIYLPVFILELYQTTQLSFENQNEISIASIEIWNTICAEIKEIMQQNINIKTPETEVVELCIQFFQKYYEGFILPFMRNLLLDSGDVDDEYQGLSVPDSSCKCLAYIIEFAGVITYEPVKNFIGNTINKQEWEYRKASVMAVGALAEVQNNEIQQLIKQALSSVFGCLVDNNFQVKRATAQTLSRVAENYPQCFHEHEQSAPMLRTLIEQLRNKIPIVQHIVWIFVHLTEGLSNFNNSIFMQEKFTILQNLASTSVRPDIKDSEIAIIDTAFMGVLNIIYTITNGKQCEEYIVQFINQIQLLESNQQCRLEIKYHLEMGLMSAIHGCVVRLDDNQATLQLFEKILQALANLDARVKNDYLYVMSGIAYAFKKKLSKYSSQLISELNKPLQDTDDIESFKTALYCLADIARAMEEEFEPYMSILSYLFGLIKNPNFNRELKIQVYNAIADIVLGLKDRSLGYMKDIKEVIKVGFSASIELTKSKLSVDQDYAERLKETMTSFYTCILHAYCDQNNPNIELSETVQWFMIFSQSMCDLKLKPTIEYVRLTLCALLDSTQFYSSIPNLRQELRQFVTSDFVVDLLKKLSQFNDKDYQECVDYAKKLLSDELGFKLKMQ